MIANGRDGWVLLDYEYDPATGGERYLYAQRADKRNFSTPDTPILTGTEATIELDPAR